MVRTVNVYGGVKFHQCWSYLNNNCLPIDLPFLLELIHFLNFDFLVYLKVFSEVKEEETACEGVCRWIWQRLVSSGVKNYMLQSLSIMSENEN